MNIKYIIIHHSLTKDGEVKDWTAIKKYHMEVMKFVDIGYHYGIEKVNGQYVVQIGRQENQIGAHTLGQNACSIGICVVGNFDNELPNPKAMDLLVDLCKQLVAKYNLTPEMIITHHRFASYKTCPGKKFPMDELRKRVAQDVENQN